MDPFGQLRVYRHLTTAPTNQLAWAQVFFSRVPVPYWMTRLQGAALPPDQGLFAKSSRDLGLHYAEWNPDAVFTVRTSEAHAAGLLAFPFATLRKI